MGPVPHETPEALHCHLCEPHMDVTVEDDQSLGDQQPPLQECFVSSPSPSRDQEWRNSTIDSLP